MRPDILVKYNSLISFIFYTDFISFIFYTDFNYDFTSSLFCSRTTY